jgi:glycosyltransferase involved in cell wall biosynthesis
MPARETRRIGLIIGQLTVGGAEGQLYELLRGMDRSRFEPTVYSLASAEGALPPRLASTGARVRVIGSAGLERARRLARALRADRVQLVHSWLFIANSYAWAARLAGARLPLVTSARNCKSQGIVHHLLNVAAFRRSRRIIVNSVRVRDYIVRSYRAPAARIQVVHNGVDTTRFAPGGGERSPSPVVLAAGRLVAQKNFELLIEAAARIRRELPAVRFLIAGDGPQRGRLVERLQALGLNGAVELLGERADMEELLRCADVFWLTSSWEGLPNAVLEAMASGLPVVATDVGGTGELFASGREGFLVRPDSVDDFVYFGAALLRDEPLRRRMGAAARRRAQQFSLRSMVQATEAIYDAVLGEAP